MSKIEFIMTSSEAYINLLKLILDGYDFESSPRGKKIREKFCVSTKFDMQFPLVNLSKRKLSYKFAFAESWFILTAKNDVESLRPYNSKMAAFSEDGVTFYGAYGPEIVPQLHYVVDKLITDSDTRQAVATIWVRNPYFNHLDVPCTVALQWVIRDGKIYCHDFMRSSDTWLGWPYDVFNFSMMTYFICLRIRELTGRMLQLGDFCLTATSQHLYENNLDDARLVVDYPDPANKVLSNVKWNPYNFLSSKDLIVSLKSKADELLVNPDAHPCFP